MKLLLRRTLVLLFFIQLLPKRRLKQCASLRRTPPDGTGREAISWHNLNIAKTHGKRLLRPDSIRDRNNDTFILSSIQLLQQLLSPISHAPLRNNVTHPAQGAKHHQKRSWYFP